MRLSSLPRALCALALAGDLATAAFPAGPFSTSGRWIVAADGSNVNFAGVNWPGAGEAMIPEGLQYQSVQSIVSRIKSLGMNSIRLTYATEMVDQIFDNGGADVPVQKAMVAALGQTNGTAVFEKILAKNPGFNSSTSRLQMFDAVVAECAKQEIYVILDNHVSKAKWCCTPLDGNSWWGDTLFSTANWTRGLSYMAEHGKSWPNLMALSIRNELRQPFTNLTLFQQSYNWEFWYARTRSGAAAIHAANPDPLVLLSGLESDTTLQPVVQGTSLAPGTAKFAAGDYFPGAERKLALELHSYSNIVNQARAQNCTALRPYLMQAGWAAMSVSQADADAAGGVRNRMPILMSEFGWGQNEDEWKAQYAGCLMGFLKDDVRAGWMIWVVSGSYYTRNGVQDDDEGWALLNHDWSDWRSPHVEKELKALVGATTAATSGGGASEAGGSGSAGGSGDAGGGGGGGSGGKSAGGLAYGVPSIGHVCVASLASLVALFV